MLHSDRVMTPLTRGNLDFRLGQFLSGYNLMARKIDIQEPRKSNRSNVRKKRHISKYKDEYKKRFDVLDVLAGVAAVVGPFHLPGQNYVGPGTQDMTAPVLNRLDEIACQHDLEYGKAKSSRRPGLVKMAADDKMIEKLWALRNRNLNENVALIIMEAKKRIGI